MNSRKTQLTCFVNMSCLLALCAACAEYKVLGEEVEATTGGAASVNTTQNPSLGGGATVGGAGVISSATTGGSMSGPNTTPPKACPLVNSNLTLYDPTQADAPCPPIAPSSDDDIIRTCDASQVANTLCLFPNVHSSDFGEIARCDETGADMYTWSSSSMRCYRSGDACREGLDTTSGTVGIVASSQDCSNRAPVTCDGSYVTAQAALDNQLGTIARDCVQTVLGSGQPASLSVWFTAGCASSFSVYPSEITGCVKQRLETERYDCVSDLECAASGVVGRCDLC
jgi:hypothetical protein